MIEQCARLPLDLLRRYYFVGRLQEAVQVYGDSGDLDGMRRVQRSVLDAYALDFAKHAPAYNTPRLSRIWKSIPSHSLAALSRNEAIISASFSRVHGESIRDRTVRAQRTSSPHSAVTSPAYSVRAAAGSGSRSVREPRPAWRVQPAPASTTPPTGISMFIHRRNTATSWKLPALPSDTSCDRRH